MAKKWACVALLVVAAALIPARWAEKTCLAGVLPEKEGLALHPDSEHQTCTKPCKHPSTSRFLLQPRCGSGV